MARSIVQKDKVKRILKGNVNESDKNNDSRYIVDICDLGDTLAERPGIGMAWRSSVAHAEPVPHGDTNASPHGNTYPASERDTDACPYSTTNAHPGPNPSSYTCTHPGPYTCSDACTDTDA
jgi:hypothetical protein